VKRNQVPLQSLITFSNSQGDAARGTLLKLERSIVVFEVYNPYSIVQLSEILRDVTIRRGDRIIYQGRAVVSNLLNTGLMLIVSASLIDPWSRVPAFYEDAAAFRQEAYEFIGQWAYTTNIREGYRIAVSRLCNFLKELNQWLQQIEAHDNRLLSKRLVTYDALFDYAGPILNKLGDLIRKFEGQAKIIEPPDVAIHKAFLQRELHPLTMSAPFLHRTFYKPLGYAGDYEMMNMIHHTEPDGTSVYAKLVNAAYVSLPIAICVRNRARILERYLMEGVQRKALESGLFRVVSIGCGPAIEVQRFAINCPLAEKSSFDLIDFNEETLNYAHRKVMEAMNTSGHRLELTIINQSVNGLLKTAASRAFRELQGKYDFVYCAGLFDYLSDKVCIRLLRLFYSWLRENGTLLVTNMHEGQCDKYVLEHVSDWYLIYRNEKQMQKMIPGLGVQRTFTDETGINLCLEVQNTDGNAIL
jgi:extracellular factor (EF) 3-hydroxypalmitic acid methyl ester biosynthesis protein